MLRKKLAAVTAAVLGVLAIGPPVAADPGDEPGTYANHIMDDLADAFSDPSIIQGKDGYWYAYATQTSLRKDNRGGEWDDQYFMPIMRSADLVDWEYVGEVFSRDNHPHWRDFDKTYYWAPDVRYMNGRYYLYYAAAGGGGPRNQIGLATAPTPAGPWTDIGQPVIAEDDGANQIDPAVFVDDDGSKYLYYGSFKNAGVRAVELNAEGTAPVGESVQVVGARQGEAPYVVEREGWYYLFYSGLGCCEREKGGYPVFVGRSESPLGPFTDAEGDSLTGLYPGGTIVNSPNGNRWVASGHSANVVDHSGQDWILVNGFDRFEEDLTWGGRPTLMDRLDWVDGWPTVNAGAWSSDGPQTAPVGTWDAGSRFEDGLAGFDTAGPGRWKTGEDDLSGGYARSAANSPNPSFLLPEAPLSGDVRLESDVRVTDDRGRAGLVLAYQDSRNNAVAWIDADGLLSVEVKRHGRVTDRVQAQVHDGADPSTWHALTAEIASGTAHVELSAALLGMPLAEVDVAVPDDWARGGAASTRGAAEIDNLGATALYEPVTERVADPEVGDLIADYSEEFDDAELAGWDWFGAADGQVEDGSYVWPTQDADLSGKGTMASALLRDAPEGTYTVETKLHLPISEDPAVDESQRPQAGLVAFQSPEDSIHLAPVRNGPSGQVLLWIGRDRIPWPEMQVGTAADEMWLRLRHTVDPDTGEHLFQAATSRDGEHYVWGGVWQLPEGVDPQIGLVSMAGEGLTATFEYVRFYE
ncbi:family 43 glycosylhydrolase [Glycomyces harbinensis]|uniref:Glycosyl hydrolases family 43 n=1 Tax=Glycomyces harbinensis TaxID=58114 RepID=A0A1G7ARA8_9ACTN|nr:family 43 glycosylhydrolase [Glycomyces harbinensis]SDE17408.1 Glycosyl hydrolases family 43 [Glycomyces harbinensis]